MVKINVVAVGKVKEKYFTEGISEYAKRLSKFCSFNIVEIEEENFSKLDDGTKAIILEREADRILPHLKGHVIAMAIEGKGQSSQAFATQLKTLINSGKGVITFVIGGSYGLDKKIKDRADGLFSFSQMTFPHTLFRLMLCEQIYRAFAINAGSNYHK